MATTEIASTNWQAFCQRFIDLHQGSLMTVSKIELNGKTAEVVREMPLTKAWMEKGECNDRMLFSFEQAARREILHEIVEPIHVKVREESDGRKSLQVDAEDGSTLILFHSGKLDQLLDRTNPKQPG